jgi:predicted lipid-binding transport protein (Tim44 family)
LPIALIADVVARAGGGQNFGGGHSSGGGGGGLRGGGGGGGGFFLWPFFLGGGGAGGIIGFLLLLVIIVFVVGVVRYWLGGGGRGLGGGSGAATEPPVSPSSYGTPPPAPTAPPPGAVGAAAGGAAMAGASGRFGAVAPVPVAAAGYDDTHPVGVPERFRGATLPGSDEWAHQAVPAETVSAGIDAIKQHDPAFDQAAFIADVERSFFLVQQAWSERRPELSRRVMADGIWQQHRLQIEQYEQQHRRNMLDNLSIGNADVVAAHSDQSYDTITVRILAASADYDVDDASGKVVRGNRNVDTWTEDWVYQRSSDATTKPSGTLSAHCPNCGAPLDVDLAGVCSYCKAPVMSGKYDWVLTRIDQV